jgi:hypothetical protein
LRDKVGAEQLQQIPITAQRGQAEQIVVPKVSCRRRRAADGQHSVSVTTGESARKPWRIMTADSDIDAADLVFLTCLHGPRHDAVPCAKARYRSRTEEVRGSNPSPPPQPRRRERRQRRAGDAHCMLRPCGGRTLKSQFSREGLQRPSGSALGHIDHAAWSPASCLSWSATWSTWPHCQPLPTTTTIQVDSPLAQHGLRQLRGPGSNLRQRRAVVDNASHPRRRG